MGTSPSTFRPPMESIADLSTRYAWALLDDVWEARLWCFIPYVQGYNVQARIAKDQVGQFWWMYASDDATLGFIEGDCPHTDLRSAAKSCERSLAIRLHRAHRGGKWRRLEITDLFEPPPY